MHLLRPVRELKRPSCGFVELLLQGASHGVLLVENLSRKLSASDSFQYGILWTRLKFETNRSL